MAGEILPYWALQQYNQMKSELELLRTPCWSRRRCQKWTCCSCAR